MFAEKQNGAISRRVSSLNEPISVAAARSSMIFPGEIRLFAGASSPPFNWLICDGALLPRVQYSTLFNVIGTLYGKGDEGETHFRLPDFRGRIPLGVDKFEVRVAGATQAGSVGGQALHQLTVEQLPSHQHGTGSLAIVSAGAHTHRVTDPGHDHGGKTRTGYPLRRTMRDGGVWGIATTSGIDPNIIAHDHEIARDYSHVSINSDGLHSHELQGETGAVGTGQRFSIMQPYQAINYIIYTG
jgi:microcystin-dependent protein